jgi:hypothetical protein
VFLISYLTLFLEMSRRPYKYDEGIVLTAAMRVAAGQLPHRDFYAIYGPAQFYVLAGLFKSFGESLLVERLYDLFIKAFLVTSVYTIASIYSRRSVAACTAAATVCLLISVNNLAGTAQIPVSLLNIIASAVVLPAFLHGVSRKRMFAAGAVAGIATLFRYDTGVALFGVQICVLATATFLKDEPGRWRMFASALWPYLLAFTVVTLPVALFYLSVAPIQPFVHDIIVYPSKFYPRTRKLPFPGMHPRQFEDLEIYLPLVAVGLSIYAVVFRRLGYRSAKALISLSEDEGWLGFLITFGLLALVMYGKGLVRVAIGQMYIANVPSLLLTAVLFQYRRILPRLGRACVMGLVCLSALATTWGALHETKLLYLQHVSVPERLFSSVTGASSIETTWCKTTNALTRGFCFLPEEERLQTIEFVDRHTRPDQKLYVGLTAHDKAYANDNIIYFGAQRLPATRWSHFDPFLQNSYEIQAQMVQELEMNAPPYIVLDSEFQQIREPNESSTSTGVTLLDEYIHRRYQHIDTFGEMFVWQRIS